MAMKDWRLAIFASGGGSNARKIMDYFSGHPHIHICLIVYNRKEAGVAGQATEMGVSSVYRSKKQFRDAAKTLQLLHSYRIDAIILAGYLSLIPDYLVKAYPGKILNIHPALLPAYGGHGMYGHHVHHAVSRSGDRVSGITIHLVDEKYDNGPIIFQAETPIIPGSPPAEIASRVLKLEHQHYARVIESYFIRL